MAEKKRTPGPPGRTRDDLPDGTPSWIVRDANGKYIGRDTALPPGAVVTGTGSGLRDLEERISALEEASRRPRP